jgi:hypothetical protein
MGFFDRMKKAAEVALEVGSGDFDIGPSADAPPVAPWPRPGPPLARPATRSRASPGRWEAVDAEWSARAAADPALGARLAAIG